MPDLKNLFSEHPKSVNETYLEHLMFATGFGLRMLAGGIACILHGILPFLFERTGSKCVCDLHQRLGASGRPTKDASIEPDQVVQS